MTAKMPMNGSPEKRRDFIAQLPLKGNTAQKSECWVVDLNKCVVAVLFLLVIKRRSQQRSSPTGFFSPAEQALKRPVT
jgi:hypothetical protein